jgi:hypothetical protein
MTVIAFPTERTPDSRMAATTADAKVVDLADFREARRLNGIFWALEPGRGDLVPLFLYTCGSNGPGAA